MPNRSVEVELSIPDAELTLTGPSVSWRWAAPEVLEGEQPGLASDIWALGWIAWEVNSQTLAREIESLNSIFWTTSPAQGCHG